MPKLFITIVLIFGSVVAGLFYLGPLWSEFQTIRQETEGLRKISVELDELLDNRNKLVQTINTISKEDIKRIEQALPVGPKSANFLVLLEALAAKHRLILRRVDLASVSDLNSNKSQPKPGGAITPVSAPGTVREFPVNVGVSGSYEAFRGFLSDLEKNIRVIDIQNVSFASPGRPDQFEFSLRGKTYYQ